MENNSYLCSIFIKNRLYMANYFKTIMLAMLLCATGNTSAQQINDNNTPLHLMKPDYRVGYGVATAERVKQTMDCVLKYIDAETPAVLEDKNTGEAWLCGVNIPPYGFGNVFNHDSLRNRKLLLHKHEIKVLSEKVKVKGYTVVPLELYLKDGRAKLEIALAKGKDLYDKRQALKEKDTQREIDRNMRNYY